MRTNVRQIHQEWVKEEGTGSSQGRCPYNWRTNRKKTLGRGSCGRNPWRASERQTLDGGGRRRTEETLDNPKKRPEENKYQGIGKCRERWTGGEGRGMGISWESGGIYYRTSSARGTMPSTLLPSDRFPISYPIPAYYQDPYTEAHFIILSQT